MKILCSKRLGVEFKDHSSVQKLENVGLKVNSTLVAAQKLLNEAKASMMTKNVFGARRCHGCFRQMGQMGRNPWVWFHRNIFGIDWGLFEVKPLRVDKAVLAANLNSDTQECQPSESKAFFAFSNALMP